MMLVLPTSSAISNCDGVSYYGDGGKYDGDENHNQVGDPLDGGGGV